jgi:hypothetical protein
VQALEENIIDMKTLRRIMNLVHSNFQLRFMKGHLQQLMNRIKDEFKQFFGIQSEDQIKVDAYGLTGAGIYFINSTLKVQIRVNNASEKRD